MKKISVCALGLLLLGFSACDTTRTAPNSAAITGSSNGITVTSTANQNGRPGENISTANGETSASPEITHPVFDIKDFDKYSFDETSELFNFDVQSAVTKINGRNLISYLLVITPRFDEKIDNIVVTASLHPKWLEILSDKNRNTLYFGTNKGEPFNMKKGSDSEKGLISDIGKDLQNDISPEQTKDYLNLPIKVVIKYNDKTSSFTFAPSKILFLGKDMTSANN